LLYSSCGNAKKTDLFLIAFQLSATRLQGRAHHRERREARAILYQGYVQLTSSPETISHHFDVAELINDGPPSGS
jgi:hypothetical protein